jgi:hypothetical protein
MHYRRLMYKPRPRKPRKPNPLPLSLTDPMAFIQTKINIDVQGCWNWLGYVDKRTGYGYVTVRGERWRAHRFSYVRHGGVIPEGLVLDHLCRNRRCVNPDHLEPVASTENVQRGLVGHGIHVPNVMTGCKRHGFSNGYAKPTKLKCGRPSRRWQCRTCRAEMDRRRRPERKALLAAAVAARSVPATTKETPL